MLIIIAAIAVVIAVVVVVLVVLVVLVNVSKSTVFPSSRGIFNKYPCIFFFCPSSV